MKIEVKLSIGYPTAIRRKVIEIDDDTPEDVIWKIVDEWADQYIEKSYKVVKK